MREQLRGHPKLKMEKRRGTDAEPKAVRSLRQKKTTILRTPHRKNPPGYSDSPQQNVSDMSLSELHDRIRTYQSLLDRLVAADDSERANLLKAYYDTRRENSTETALEGLDIDHGQSQVNGTMKLPCRFDASDHEEQDTTLAVLGCGVFSLYNVLLSPY